MRIFRVRYIERKGNMWFGSNEKSHRMKSCSLPNLILVPHLGGPTQENHDCFESDLLRKYRDDQKTEAPKGICQDMISKFTKNLEQISASFANPQVTSTLGIWKRPEYSSEYSSATLVPPVYTTANVSSPRPRKRQPHSPPNTASCFVPSWAEIPRFSMRFSMQSTPAGPVPEKWW